MNVPGVKLAHAQGGSHAQAEDPQHSTSLSPIKCSRVAFAFGAGLAFAGGSLFGALDYLTSFPYGCVEQTMSSFLPDITVQQAVRDLGLKVDLDQAALQEKIRAGLDRLYTFQHRRWRLGVVGNRR